MDLVPKKKNLWDAFLVFLSLKELWILPGCFVHPVVCSLSVGGDHCWVVPELQFMFRPLLGAQPLNSPGHGR